MSDLIKVYQQQVDDLAGERKSFRVSNRNVAHAAVLLDAILKHAEQEVRIFCGSFSESFYGQESLKLALINYLHKPGSRLLILVQNPVPKTHSVLQALQPYLGSKVEVRQAVGVENLSHFAVMDRIGYRYEFSHDPNDPAIVEAVANFNEPKVAANLADRFDRIFSTSTPVLAS